MPFIVVNLLAPRVKNWLFTSDIKRRFYFKCLVSGDLWRDHRASSFVAGRKSREYEVPVRRQHRDEGGLPDSLESRNDFVPVPGMSARPAGAVDERRKVSAGVPGWGRDCMKKASVVVPTYNRWSSLQSCLDALLCQALAHDDYEIIVVADGSTDGTGRGMPSYTSDPRVRFLPAMQAGFRRRDELRDPGSER